MNATAHCWLQSAATRPIPKLLWADLLLIGRVAIVAQQPIIAMKLSRKRSVGLYVRLYVGLSSALWKNGGSDPDAVWHRRSDGSRDEAVGFGDRSTGRGTFGGEFGAGHCN